ncbi:MULTISPECIES: ribosome biogenesis GTP-binding protein YihA/YsxC [unclassified Thioalkalivibrio]|uniref:ribosome biogenesis GTP-binding protein YihA/YsxC n=1 Tax=unclassified Thioalkalivibrio TaxID=2621013 RepID=UPI0003748FF9|nr:MULTISPECIES: ribosome biogenesis GTP-binding protein YihA/YsxC [unclassified Thioalkalivibrio]
MEPRFRETDFLRGVAQIAQLPADTGVEIAFAGRSNAGKSSALNALCGRKALARVGRTPGRTQEINLFRLPPAEHWRLVDLPGYGYAKVSAGKRAEWDQLLGGYLQTRQCLVGLVLIMDIRRPLTELDRQLLDWVPLERCHLHCLLTKADKLSRQEADRQLRKAHGELEAMGVEATLQTFSSLKNQGVDDLRGLLGGWLAEHDTESAPANG